MMPSFIVLHPLQLLARSNRSPKELPGATDYSKAEYTNTQQDLPVGITNSPTLDMIGSLATGFLLLKSNKEYVLTFNILAQVPVGILVSKLAI
jgi:hypothetical protein